MNVLTQYYSPKTLLDFGSMIEQAVVSCENLPLAIAILGGLKLKKTRDWHKLLNLLNGEETDQKSVGDGSVLHILFNFSIHRLDQSKQHLFRDLGVFKRVKIPITSIMSLWKLNELAARQILTEFSERSLLKYIDRNR